MPKIKTRRAAAKRFKITKSGKIFRRYAKMRHLLECKPSGKTRGKRGAVLVSAADKGRVADMLPGR